MVAKAEQNNRRKLVRQNSGPGRKAIAAPDLDKPFQAGNCDKNAENN